MADGLVEFLVGGFPAAVSATAAAPIERVKLLIQNQDEIIKSGQLSEPFNGISDCFVRIIKDEGLFSLWRGNSANVIRCFLTQILSSTTGWSSTDLNRFIVARRRKAKRGRNRKSSTEWITQMWLDRGWRESGPRYWRWFAVNMPSGGIVGAFFLSFVYSLDYARTLLANDVKGGGQRQFDGLIDVYKKTIKSHGITGLYRGFGSSCVGIVVYRALYFGLYDSLKPLVLVGRLQKDLLASFLFGWVIKIGATLASYPFDTVSRRMMITSGEAVKYKSSLHAFQTIVANEGANSLFKGAGANLLRVVVGAVALAGYQKLVLILVRKITSIGGGESDMIHDDEN